MVPHPGTFAPPGAVPDRVPASAWPFPQPGPPPISGPLPAVPADASIPPHQPSPVYPANPAAPGHAAAPGYNDPAYPIEGRVAR